MSTGYARARTIVSSALAVLAAALILRTLYFAYEFFRPMPYWDQWEFVKSLPAVLSGKYTLSDLFAFHNEHRIVTSRLIFILDAFLFSSAGFFPSILLIAVLVLTSIVMSFISDTRTKARLLLILMITSSLLSISHSDNFSSGFQVQFPLVNLFSLLSIVCFSLSIANRDKNWASLGCAVLFVGLAIISMASGNILIAPLIVVAFLLGAKAWKIALVSVASVAMSACYFIGYPNPDVAHSHDPIGVSHFAIAYLGSALRGYPHAPTALGAGLLVLYAAALVLAVRDRLAGRVVDRWSVCLLGLATFVLASAVITATGRLSLGLEAAVVSRYALQSLIFSCCLFLIAWRLSARLPSTDALRVTASVAFMALVTMSTTASLPLREWKDRVADYDVAGFALASDVVTEDAMAGVYPHLDLIRPVLGFLRDHRLGPFSAAHAAVYRPPENAAEGPSGQACQGHIDSVTRIDAQRAWIRGWIMSTTARDGDGWLLVRDSTGRLLGAGRQDLDRPDVAQSLGGNIERLGFAVGLNSGADGMPSTGAMVMTLIPGDRSAPLCTLALPPS